MSSYTTLLRSNRENRHGKPKSFFLIHAKRLMKGEIVMEHSNSGMNLGRRINDRTDEVSILNNEGARSKSYLEIHE